MNIYSDSRGIFLLISIIIADYPNFIKVFSFFWINQFVSLIIFQYQYVQAPFMHPMKKFLHERCLFFDCY